MRRLVLERDSRAADLLAALAEPGPLELTLRGAPEGLSRLELLEAVAGAPGPLLARFSGRLVTPLSEAACLALEASWEEGAVLDFFGTLLSPLLARVGAAGARRLLLRHGSLVPAGEVLGRSMVPGSRSLLAMALVRERLDAGLSGGFSAAMAHERALFGLVFSAPDRVEGVRAFREKRPASFDW